MSKFMISNFPQCYADDISNIIEQLPLLEYFMKNCCGTVYGGFIRWSLDTLLHGREYNLTTVLEYLDNADVDLILRHYYDDYSWSNNVGLHGSKFIKHILKLGYKIEYIGNDYHEVAEYLPNDKYVSIGESGTYKIYIPHPFNNDKWINYDFTLLYSEAFGYTDDFTVNNLQFNYDHEIKYYTFNRRWKSISIILSDLYNKNMSPLHTQHTVHFIHRFIKMWKKGYRPLTKSIRDILVHKIKKLLETGIYAYIIKSGMSPGQGSDPTVVDDNKKKHIPVSQCERIKLSGDFYENDREFQHIFVDLKCYSDFNYTKIVVIPKLLTENDKCDAIINNSKIIHLIPKPSEKIQTILFNRDITNINYVPCYSVDVVRTVINSKCYIPVNFKFPSSLYQHIFMDLINRSGEYLQNLRDYAPECVTDDVIIAAIEKSPAIYWRRYWYGSDITKLMLEDYISKKVHKAAYMDMISRKCKDHPKYIPDDYSREMEYIITKYPDLAD